MWKPIAGAIARHAIGFIGASLVSKGIFTPEQVADIQGQVEVAVGAIAAIAALVWSIKQKKSA